MHPFAAVSFTLALAQATGPTVGASYGGISVPDQSESLETFVVRVAHAHELSPRWRLELDYPLVSRVGGTNWYGDDQSSAWLGAPVIFLRSGGSALGPFRLSAGAGVAPLPRLVNRLRARPPEYAGDAAGPAMVISGQRDRAAFADRWVTLIAPLELTSASTTGAFASASLDVEIGVADEAQLDARAALAGGYRAGAIAGGVAVVAFQELVHELGKTMLGELSFRGGQARQLSVEPFVAAGVGRLALSARATWAGFSADSGAPAGGYSALAVHLSVGLSMH